MTYNRIELGQPPNVTGLDVDELVTHNGDPYITRHHVTYGRGQSVRFHHWHASDDQGAPHDHPWHNVTLVLAGRMVEHTDAGNRILNPGDLVLRDARTTHAIELATPDAWTLFTTGPVVRRWGYRTLDGWTYWRDYEYAGRVIVP